MSQPIQHVSDTAFLVAEHRAVESARPDALFRDPLAAKLSGERGREIARQFATNRMSGWSIAIRTRLIDELVQEAIRGGVDTVLNLGAGLDTRPYRLELPTALRWVEVDYPHVLAFKEERLTGETTRCRVERVPLDLADRPARGAFWKTLEAAGGRVLVLTEGVIPYLTTEEVATLADDLLALANAQAWIVDWLSPEMMRYRQRAGVERQMAQAPFRFVPEDWTAFFASHGWRVRERRSLFDEAQRYGRSPPLPFLVKALIALTRPFTPPERRRGLANSTGYAVLEKSRA